MSNISTDNRAAHSEQEYAEFLAWVETILPRIESPSENGIWCTQWWDHPEVVDRLDALHLAWLSAAKDNELSNWWVVHWDHHWPRLTSRDGPFRECRDGTHQRKDRKWTKLYRPPAEGLA